LIAGSHKFATATPYVQTIGLSDISNYTQDGTLVSNPNYPFELIFEPSSSVNSLFPSTYQEDFTLQLASIPSGTTVYHVYAKADPNAPPALIGDLVL